MNRTTLDPYVTLDIPRGASEEQVKQAYRRLAKRYHPDLHPTAGTTERMQRVNQAWEILSNPAQRARYDADFASRGSADVGYWSASRRTAPRSSASTAWDGTSAWRPPRAPRYSSAGSRPYADRGGASGCAVALLIVAVCLFALIALFTGIIPFPLAGLVLFAFVRGIFGLFDERRR
jgi:curved DNA-binding protein CbpA